MRFLSPKRETLLVGQKTPPNWEEHLLPWEEDTLDEMVKQGLAGIVTLAHPTERGRTGQFYFVTPQGEIALACAAMMRREIAV